MAEFVRSIVSRMSAARMLLLILFVGIVIRLAIASLSITYDSDYWTIVIRNIESGFGIYELEGYYYTPAWGYILGLIGAFQTVFMDMGEVAVRVVEAIFVEGIGMYVTATIPSLWILYTIKLPLYVCDTITAFLIRGLVRDQTGDGRKADLAFALVFLSPVLLESSGVIAMPDTIAVMFTVLTIVLLKKDCPFLAGMTFAIAVLIKFFPVFLFFVFIAYILSKNKGDRRRAVSHVAQAAIGALITVGIMFLPPFLEGNLAQCFQFLTDRTGFAGGDLLFDTIAGILRILTYGLVVIGCAYCAYDMYRDSSEDHFGKLMKACLIIATLALVYPPTTQYIVILVPFLAYYIVTSDRRMMKSWTILGVGAVIYSSATNGLMFMPLAVWAGVGDVGFLLDLYSFWNAPFLGPISIEDIQFVIGGVLQCAGILLILWMLYGDRLLEYRASRSVRG